jgi:O-glycosyl hydrolase
LVTIDEEGTMYFDSCSLTQVRCASATLTLISHFCQIPLIKEAQELSERGFHLLACAWTAPPWMKTNGDYSGFGFLKLEYYQAWADYLVK